MIESKPLFSAFIDILFPKTCHLCAKDIKDTLRAFDPYICSSCAHQMRQTPAISCLLCGGKITEKEELKTLHCDLCAKTRPAYDKLLTCYRYEGATKELIHKFKYDNRPYLARTIARLMLRALEKDNITDLRKVDALVPVPLAPARQREREFNQSQVLAEALSSPCALPVVAALKRIRHTPAQASLKGRDRSKNLKGAFCLNRALSLKNKHLLLVDDVVTTTATVREASRALKESGASRITVLAFAKG